MRVMAMLTLVAGGCGTNTDGCLHRDLDAWCFHQENANGPVPPEEGSTCEPPELRVGGQIPAGTERCGDFLVVSTEPNFVGTIHYFDAETEAHVATQYWTDVNGYCGGFVFWYGERVACETSCTFDTPVDEPSCP